MCLFATMVSELFSGTIVIFMNGIIETASIKKPAISRSIVKNYKKSFLFNHSHILFPGIFLQVFPQITLNYQWVYFFYTHAAGKCLKGF